MNGYIFIPVFKMTELYFSDKELVYLDSTSGLSIFDIETQIETQIVANTTFVSDKDWRHV